MGPVLFIWEMTRRRAVLIDTLPKPRTSGVRRSRSWSWNCGAQHCTGSTSSRLCGRSRRRVVFESAHTMTHHDCTVIQGQLAQWARLLRWHTERKWAWLQLLQGRQLSPPVSTGNVSLTSLTSLAGKNSTSRVPGVYPYGSLSLPRRLHLSTRRGSLTQ